VIDFARAFSLGYDPGERVGGTRSMKILSVAITLALLTCALGLEAQTVSKGPTVNAEYDRNKDFEVFKSYDWMKSQEPAPSMANHIRLTRAIQKEMEDLGISADTANPSLRILYRVSTRKRVEATGSQKRETSWDPTNITTGFTFGKGSSQDVGTLVIELYDAATNALVWKCTTTQALGTPDKAEKIINEAVKRAFTKYPTRDKK
jgi:hypothetical protein